MKGVVCAVLLVLGALAEGRQGGYYIEFDNFMDGMIDYFHGLQKVILVPSSAGTEYWDDFTTDDFSFKDVTIQDLRTVKRTGANFESISVDTLALQFNFALGFENLTVSVGEFSAPAVTNGQTLKDVVFTITKNAFNEKFNFNAVAATKTCTIANTVELLSLDEVTMHTSQDAPGVDVSAFFNTVVRNAIQDEVNKQIHDRTDTYDCSNDYLIAAFANLFQKH